MKEKVTEEARAFSPKSFILVDRVAMCCTEISSLLGVNVAMVALAEPLSVLKTVPETALLELSTKVKVLLVIVELSINSLKVAEMLEASVVAPSDGEVEETVGAVVSSLKAYDSKAGMVVEIPRLL